TSCPRSCTIRRTANLRRGGHLMPTTTDALLDLAAEAPRDTTDRHLLERFVAQRDERALTTLVRRYGRAVWGVCHRVVPREQDAEAALQAVFLVLAQKAASIRRGEAGGSWLYGVAYRTAMRARHNAVRRQECEKHARASTPDEPWSEAACREFQRILDEE